MNTARPDVPAKGAPDASLLILPDGQVFAHNLTPLLAAVLAELNPADQIMRQRAQQATVHQDEDEAPSAR